MGRRNRPAARRLHPHSREVAALRSRLAKARPYRKSDPPRRSLGEGAARAWARGRNCPSCRTHAAALFRCSCDGQGQRCPDGAALRAPRQAAGDDRLAQGWRSVVAVDRGRQTLRPRRRRRRLRGVCLARGDWRARRAGHRACALRRHDRDLRGERQLRSARVSRSARAADGRSRLRRRARLGLRRLRTAVGDDIAARDRGGDARGRRADRRRAFGRRERHRALVVPHRARVARSARGLGDRPDPADANSIVPIPEERAAQARAAADILGDIVFRKYPFAGDTKPMVAGRAEALLNRTWRPALSIIGADGLPRDRRRGQRAAAADLAQAFAAAAAHARRRTQRPRT